MEWLYYLIEANCYLCIFYAFYHFVLKQEPVYTLNRFYLLITSILSFILPLLTVSYTKTATHLFIQPGQIVYDLKPSVTVAGQHQIQQISSVRNLWEVEKTLPFLYFIVVLFFFLITLKEIFKLVIRFKQSIKHKTEGVVYVELNGDKEEVFSFFNWLFLHPKMFKNEVIIAHEMVHIRQGHSFDVLFFEFIRCINWFNPCTYLLFKDAKLNHEYISDQHTAAKMQTKYDYANLLIQHAYVPKEHLSHSAFSKTQLEQRIIQLSKQSNKKKGLLKYLIIFPLLVLLFFISAFKIEKSYGWINFNVSADKTLKAVPPSIHFPVPNAESVKVNQNKSDTLLKDQPNKPVLTEVVSDHQLSELVSGPTTMNKIAAAMAKEGKKVYAIDYELFWAKNESGSKIRKVIHSICIGTESQLFRGKHADTLYIDQGYYSIENGTVHIKTDNLWINAMDYTAQADKHLILINAFNQKIIAKLDRVDIRTTGLIHNIVLNPYFRYGKDGVLDSVADNQVDVKKRDANRKYISNVRNVYIREARITSNEIITNETKTPKEDLRQPGIIW